MPIVASGLDHKGKYELNNKSAELYLLNNLRGEYINNDTGDVVRITRASTKVTHHDAENDIHLKSIALIPQMIKESIFIDEVKNEKGSKFDTYRYYVVGLKVEGSDYTAKLVVGTKNGKSYYDHSMTKIEKSNLINLTDGVKADVSGNLVANFGVKDKRLISILQTNCSKVVDENGEPMVVLHGTPNSFTVFDTEKIGSSNDSGWLGSGFYFYGNNPEYASQYARGGNIMKVFLNIRNPYYASYSEFERLAEENSREASDEFSDMIREEGCDGVFYNEDLNAEWVVFNPTQIKSATDNVGTFDANNPDIRYSLREGVSEREAEFQNQSVEEVNRKFNEDLERFENDELPVGSRLELGMPSNELRSSGFPDLPISMRASLLKRKAGMERHPFMASELKGLVNAIQKPIAVFHYSKENMRNLIANVTHGDKHFLVGVTLNYKSNGIEINSVSGLFPKESAEWIKWIQDGKAIRIDQKDKVLSLIDSLRTNPAESKRIGLDLDSVANVVENFENQIISDENISDGGVVSSEGDIRYSLREDAVSLKSILNDRTIGLKEQITLSKALLAEQNKSDFSSRSGLYYRVSGM